jgi:hypothetical protein
VNGKWIGQMSVEWDRPRQSQAAIAAHSNEVGRLLRKDLDILHQYKPVLVSSPFSMSYRVHPNRIVFTRFR